MRTLILLTLLTIVTYSYSQTFVEIDDSGEPHRLKNKPAPVFQARTLDDKEINLKELKGKVVFIDFWSLSCAACFKELPELNELIKKYPQEKFILISLMTDTKEELLKKFELAENGYNIKKPIFNNDK